MMGVNFVFFVTVVFLWMMTVSKGDTEVSCVFMEKCILPCTFQSDTDIVIHWLQETAGNIRVHSFYHNKDQPALQDKHLRGRTSLFNDQISRGNASLQLMWVDVQDEGRYKCYTSTITGNKESFINLEVNAPVQEVNLQRVGNTMNCSSEGIFPEPQLIWSTSAPSNVSLQYETTVQQTEQQLYNISSSLILSDSDKDSVFSCNISTRRNWRNATLSEQGNSVPVRGFRGGVFAAFLVVAAAGLALYCKWKRREMGINPSNRRTLNTHQL
ncbi:unnamed protein product [Oreochromis niloticus]|nr:unnamed protein product [Mustela putorius furo]